MCVALQQNLPNRIGSSNSDTSKHRVKEIEWIVGIIPKELFFFWKCPFLTLIISQKIDTFGDFLFVYFSKKNTDSQEV